MSNFIAIDQQELQGIKNQNQLLVKQNLELKQLIFKFEEAKEELKKMGKDVTSNTKLIESKVISTSLNIKSEINNLETQNNIMWLVIIIMIIAIWIKSRKIKTQEKRQEEMEQKFRKIEDRFFNILLAERSIDKDKKIK